MGAFSGQILTQRGIALLAKVMAGTANLTFTKIKVGDGELAGASPTDLTDLKHVIKTLDITAMVDTTSNSAYFTGILSNQGLVTGFYWRETGLYAQDPQLGEILFSYDYCPASPEYIPAGGGATIIEHRVRVQAIFGNAQNVSAIINQSLVYASAAELQALATVVDGKETPSGAQAKVDTTKLVFAGRGNINWVGGGEMKWGVTANRFDWSKEMRILPGGGKLLIDGVPIACIKIAAGNITIPNAWDCVYIQIPTADNQTVTLQVAQYNAIPNIENKIILAVRDTDNCLELLGAGWLVYGTTVEVGGKRDNYIPKSLVTAVNDFIIASGNGVVVKRTLAEAKSILGIDTVDAMPTSAGTSPTYTATLTGYTYVAGKKITIKFHAASTAVSTLNVNALGAKGIKKADGTDFKNIKLNGIYTFVYDDTNFILQGEGASGNAVASDLRSGKTASTDAGEITGTADIRNHATGSQAFSVGAGGTVTVTLPFNPRVVTMAWGGIGIACGIDPQLGTFFTTVSEITAGRQYKISGMGANYFQFYNGDALGRNGTIYWEAWS